MVNAGWDDVAHLDDDVKRELLASTPPHLRDARSKGTPSLGSGAIYPIAQSEFVVDPFVIPAHFHKCYGLDVGWNCTAAPFGAWDRDSDILYIYAEHYRGQAEPSVHATAIKARGDWLVGAIDPAALGSGQRDGEQLMADYTALGLNLVKANNAVEAGIMAVFERLSTGRLKVFSTCQNWLNEHRLYRRDEKGRIVKKYDHIMDASRYLVLSLPQIARTRPAPHRSVSSFQIADIQGGY